MRLPRFSQVGLIVGMTLGLLALWAGASPVLGPGDSVIGGGPEPHPVWYRAWDYDHYNVGATWQTNGEHTYNGWTISRYCADAVNWSGQPMHCTGGSISVASGPGTETMHWGSEASCSVGEYSDGECDEFYNIGS